MPALDGTVSWSEEVTVMVSSPYGTYQERVRFMREEERLIFERIKERFFLEQDAYKLMSPESRVSQALQQSERALRLELHQAKEAVELAYKAYMSCPGERQLRSNLLEVATEYGDKFVRGRMFAGAVRILSPSETWV
jgi:hypothetical protein